MGAMSNLFKAQLKPSLSLILNDDHEPNDSSDVFGAPTKQQGQSKRKPAAVPDVFASASLPGLPANQAQREVAIQDFEPRSAVAGCPPVLEKPHLIPFKYASRVPRLSLEMQTPVKGLRLSSSPETPPLCMSVSSSPMSSFSMPTPRDDQSIYLTSPASPLSGEKETVSTRRLRKHKLDPVFASQYVIHTELGAGGFGFVVKGVRVIDGKTVAIKFIYKKAMQSHSWVYDKQWMNGKKPLPREAAMLMTIKHPGIVAYIDLFEDDTYFYLVMEHHGVPWGEKHPANAMPDFPRSAPGLSTPLQPTIQKQSQQPPITPSGLPSLVASKLHVPAPPLMIRRSSCDLFECIESRSGLSEHETRYVFAQIVAICYYLSCHNIYHMDIKDENIVIDGKLSVKLIDFGSAVNCLPNKQFSQFYGTVAYAAPEILKNGAYTAPAADVWSLGILFSILLLGESIYKGPQAVLSNTYDRAKFTSLSPECQYVLQICLTHDPTKRATLAELRQLPWLNVLIKKMERTPVERS